MSMSNKPALKAAVKPTARLDASLLLARKGEAAPAVAATQHNNPGLAWGAPAHPEDFQPQQPTHQQPSLQQPVKQGTVQGAARLRPESFFASAQSHPSHGRSSAQTYSRTRVSPDRDPVALTMRVEDEMYLRLKYLAQSTGRSTQQVLAEALDDHLVHSGVPSSRKLMVKPE